MKIDISFLRNKVAKRIFILFVLCALVPISGLTVLSYVQVSGQLKKQSMDRLYNSVKSHGMSIYERFLFLETNMNILAASIKENRTSELPDAEKVLGGYSVKRFTALAIVHASGEIVPMYGKLDDMPDYLTEATDGAISEKTVIRFKAYADKPYGVFMAVRLDRTDPDSDMLVGQVEISHLWGIGYENMLPPMTGLCIVDQYRKVLVTSFEMSEVLLHQMVIRDDQTKGNYFKYSAENQEYFVSYWSIFMKSGFDSPNVNVVLRRSKADVLSPLADFKKIFPLVVLLSFWIVALLSVYHIRKSLIPLEKLKEGTLRVANNDFKSQVSFKSGDEFEDLADSFNSMSYSLDRHFEALTTRAEIDRAILSSLNLKEIVSTALKQMYTFFSCDSISINLVIEKKPLTYHSYISTNINVRKIEEQFFSITAEDEQFLSSNLKYTQIDLEKIRPGYIASSAIEKMKSALVLPLMLNQMLKGMIVLGFKNDRVISSEDLVQARQISDQVTVALSNAWLVEELEKLNLGTLEALARTVDAKSAWTAGHSERVTDLSVKIARIMSLKEKQIETLRRGAYLHDIGKIGIPLSIIDKPGRLTDEEFEIIKEHPVIGARILEPIEAYADVLLMISQHHEKFDGTGYPNGIAGDQISLGARIMAVADVYDAVVSDRPYRHGWIEGKAVDLIVRESGTHFDPAVVEAFLLAISS